MIRKGKSVIKERVIQLAFVGLPIFDSINGFLIRTKGYYGVGSKYHMVLILLLMYVAYIKPKIKVGLYEKVTLILSASLFFSICINMFVFPLESISVERIEKLIFTFLAISSLQRMLLDGSLSYKVFYNILRLQVFLVPTITLISDLSGLANYTYQTAQVGKIGFYTGSNEPVAVFAMLGGIVLIELSSSFNLKRLFLFFEIILCMILVQSKLGYFMTVVLLISFSAILFYNFLKNKKINPYYIVIGSIIIILALIIGRNIFNNTIDGFMQRQNYQKKYLLDDGLLNYLSSGRVTRLSELFSPVFDGNPLYILFKIIFGQGAKFTYSEILEMDYLDAILYGGLIAFSCLSIVTIKTLRFARKYSGNLLSFGVLFLAYIYAFVGGHVWTGGVSGIYLGLLIAYCNIFNTKSSLPTVTEVDDKSNL